MKIHELDTPALLIDEAVMERNIRDMQAYADEHGVALRPHTKTHKAPALALRQLAAGAKGITVAKTGEAEVMAAHGLKDIFIANQVVGEQKLRRIAALMPDCEISFGVDCPEQIYAAERVFGSENKTARVLIEIEVGENRTGVIEDKDMEAALDALGDCPHVRLEGVFSHDGHSYGAPTREQARRRSVEAQRRTLYFAGLARARGFDAPTVSIGSTPSQANHADILPGVTEIRPGTYILMDASQANAVEDLSVCAATVLTTVISRPTSERVVLDVGAKGITMQARTEGICATPGLGTLLDAPDVHIDSVYDEHAMIYNAALRERVRVGDKLRVIPVHICPVCNLYERAWLVNGDEVTGEVEIACRGKML